MTQVNRNVYAAIVIACVALALSIAAMVRGPGASAGDACIDRDARDQIGTLRRALAERDALIGRLQRAASAAGTAVPPVEPSSPALPAEPRSGEPRPGEPSPGPRRFTRFETANPAVSVKQNADGSYDIRNTDPALAGSIIEVTAVASSGEETKVLVRIPQP